MYVTYLPHTDPGRTTESGRTCRNSCDVASCSYGAIQYYTLIERCTMASGNSNIPATQVAMLSNTIAVALQQASVPFGSPSAFQVILNNAQPSNPEAQPGPT